MKARKCDRCGSFYENNKIRYNYRYYGVGLLAKNYIGTVENFDLCDKCLDEFEQFMANEDKTLEVEENIEDKKCCKNCKYANFSSQIFPCNECYNNLEHWEAGVSI